jgi:hypothetical protein
LSNNFENQDYYHYYPGDLYPRHESKTIVPGLYSKHTPGVSFLILPGYYIADWRGAMITLNLVGALLAANLYLLAWEITRRQGLALLLTAALMLANPLLSYSFLIFPALPAALCTLYAYRRIRLDGATPPLKGNGPWRLFAIGMCLGFLPWTHPRFLVISGALALYLVWRQRPAGWTQVTLPRLAALTIPLMGWGLPFMAYDWYLYGTIIPNYSDHAGFSAPIDWATAFFGSLFDQQWGLLIHAPVYLIITVGLLLMLRVPEWRADLLWLGAISLPYATIILTYRQWWGEWCPAARYWVPLLPLSAVPLGRAITHVRGWAFWIGFVLLATVGWGIMAIFLSDPHLMYNHPTGESRLLLWLAETWHLPNLVPFVPTFFKNKNEWSTVWPRVVYPLASVPVIWFFWRQIWDGHRDATPQHHNAHDGER